MRSWCFLFNLVLLLYVAYISIFSEQYKFDGFKTDNVHYMHWFAHGVGGGKYNGGGEYRLRFHCYQHWLMLSLQIIVVEDSLIYLALQFLISYGL
jgi:hypothetical protein